MAYLNSYRILILLTVLFVVTNVIMVALIEFVTGVTRSKSPDTAVDPVLQIFQNGTISSTDTPNTPSREKALLNRIILYLLLAIMDTAIVGRILIEYSTLRRKKRRQARLNRNI